MTQTQQLWSKVHYLRTAGVQSNNHHTTKYNSKNTFMGELGNLRGGGNFEEFSTLNYFNKTGFILGVRIGTGTCMIWKKASY